MKSRRQVAIKINEALQTVRSCTVCFLAQGVAVGQIQCVHVYVVELVRSLGPIS